ncbi:hypothetical protein ASG43_17630 [Aureimonas sp. Leaf454]|nr:hypothetical protein ASG43_17630 [Aureimonas sp. Leaf454]
MTAHYRVAQEHELARSRDGLPWRHDVGKRLRTAEAAGADVIWDLNHFDPPDDPAFHARNAASLARQDRPFWICPVNEPSIYPMLAGMGRDDAVRLALTMTRAAKDHHPDVRVLTTDPLNGIGERQFEATDALVATGLVDVVGVNYYPHTARTSLSKVLLKTARRYRLPILVAETSWHDGHREQQRRFHGMNKGAWLRHVLSEVELARTKGAEVVGVCWYPIIDSPPWNRPGARHRWSHGLIRGDFSIDPDLAAALAQRTEPKGQLGFNFRFAV